MTRTSELIPSVQERICNALRAGHYGETAARLGGISKSAYYSWLQRGRDEPSGPYKEFLDAVDAAVAEAEERALAVIEKAAQGWTEHTLEETDDPKGGLSTKTKTVAKFDWGAASWYLERKHPDRWGNRQQIEHSGQIDVAVIFEGEDVPTVPLPTGEDDDQDKDTP
jgi:transposase